ncbi:Chromo domain-containing protein [Heracleum sosnowskyi]|uniref:Chromo domain-containing protein n=1 Tax=Heracleum sosnowskyi TaxID=360622 RepID=A0AAD8NBB5_9APIA|nr:Chromo domain-containing protein [Heracleum sosnowskyi]
MKNTRSRSVAAGESEVPAPEEQVFEEMENGVEEEEDEMENGVEEEAKPKLPEGFYEIEHIRKKRVKQGEVQYLVKWRGWPESANTWEPYENLASVPDVVDAFEQRMQSSRGKTSKKRKGKSGASLSQAKRHQSAATVRVDLVEDPAPIPYHGDGDLNDGVDTNMGDIHISEVTENNGSAVFPSQVEGAQVEGAQEQNERNVINSELTNEVKAGNLGVDMQGWRAPQVSRRKKTAVVKRFRKDETDCRTDHATPEDSIRVTRSRVQAGQQCQNPVDNSGDHNDASIIQILKPMSFEASGPDQDVVVTFSALRADQKEIVVDNKFLKVNNPLMLINFYEKHLKYNADMEAQV